MRIAISGDGKNIGNNKVVAFCECDSFLIVDTKANSLIAVENKNKGLPSRVGRTAGRLVSRERIDAVIVTNIGPQAWEIFDQNGIKVPINMLIPMPIKEEAKINNKVVNHGGIL